MAVLVLKKYNPKIVSITGSVGKTSAKEAVHTVLASKFRVRRNEKNYNNEIGLPLTILGVESGQSSLLGWLRVFLQWLWLIGAPVEYPEILVLEMGADRPGDIKYLTSFIKSRVGIITDVSLSHIEFFKTIEGVAREKGTLVKELNEGGLAVLNIDNPQVAKMAAQVKERVMTFGMAEEADMRATDIAFNYHVEDVRGLSFKLNYKGTTMPVRLNNILARHQVYSALAAAAVGIDFGINLVEIAAALENLSLPSGRMNLINGLKDTLIIDDTYNSSPTSALAALHTLHEISSGRKIAVMGDMFELGSETEAGHRKVAEKFLEIKGDIFFGVGHGMEFAISTLEAHKFPKENIFHFADPETAGKKLQALMRPGDLVLVKGSQGMRMEKVVEEIMAEPQRAKELLCRQNTEWKAIPFKAV